jgi:peptidylprolyl isomerase
VSDKAERAILFVVVGALVAGAIWFQLRPREAGSPVASTDGIAGLGSNAVTTPSGLKYQDMVVGQGPTPKKGQTCVVHYLGRLTDGQEFDGSRKRGEPFRFPLGEGQVIKGWDEGVATMQVGGVRRLVVPAALGYGEAGSPPRIPANATLVFDVELLGIE